jgi:hypothetical protein
MYRIIGADGKEYGPVPAEELRQWIAVGRVNGSTLARLEASTEWKPLSSFPEFLDALSRRTPPTPPPVSNSESLAAEIIERDYDIDIGSCLSRAWGLMQRHFWLIVGATFIMIVIDSAVASIPFVGGIGSLLLSFVLWGGLDWMILRLIRGESADLGDAFVGFKQSFAPLMLGGLVAGLLLIVGCLLCILPGIYLMVSWMLFAPLLILQKRLDFWPALELSRRVVGKHWWQAFGLLVVCSLVSLAGLLACGIGIFITVPLASTAMVYAYEDIFGQAAAPHVDIASPMPT